MTEPTERSQMQLFRIEVVHYGGIINVSLKKPLNEYQHYVFQSLGGGSIGDNPLCAVPPYMWELLDKIFNHGPFGRGRIT